MTLDPTRLAHTVTTALTTYFPYAAGHVSLDASDVAVRPQELHPSFYGSFDWHSSVHMQWSGIRLLTEDVLDGPVRDGLIAVLDERLADTAIAVEADYLRARPSYERPYGWAWALQLAAAAGESPIARDRGWSRALAPLTDVVVSNLTAYLPTLAYPVRSGEHTNTAFALLLARDAGVRLQLGSLVERIDEASDRLYSADRDYDARFEPGGSDFLSPGLCEAALMRAVLGSAEGPAWVARLMPTLGAPSDPLLTPLTVLDETDGKSVHLHGLALSRAWLLRELAPALPEERRTTVAAATSRLVASALPAVNDGDFMSTHWLVSFLLLAERGLS